MSVHWRFHRESFRDKRINEGWRGDPVTTALIIAAAAVTAGTVESVQAQTASKKAAANAERDQQALMAQEKADEAAAAGKADEALTAQRRTLLASGGQTDVTGGTAGIVSGQTQAKTLLGG